MGLFDRLKEGLSRTRQGLGAALGLGPKLSPAEAEVLEAALMAADLGPELASRLVAEVGKAAPGEARRRLREGLAALSRPAGPPAALLSSPPLARPEVCLVVGVNGSGKTTTCGKLAWHFTKKGEKVLLAGADTFRAAAVEQLRLWSQRAGCEFFSQGQDADPAAVAFDAVSKAKASGFARVIIDTAGRLQTKSNLMEELKKVHRVAGKAMPGAPHRVLLVLDGTAGQNMLSQARLFHEAVPLSGLIVTKLDGSSKAGAVIQVMQALKLPVAMLGVGEAPEDLQEFDPEAFAAAMVDA